MSNVREIKTRVKSITLNDGVERQIKFDLNAMAELEDKYGSVEAAFNALEKNSIKAIRSVLWAGLLHSDPTLTEQQVGNLIDMQCMQEIVTAMTEAFGNDMPEDKQAPNAGQPKLIVSAT